MGTPYFISPEIIKNENYGSKCDVWSLGVITYLLFTGEMPFKGENRESLFKVIKSGQFKKEGVYEKLSSGVREFIEKCLTVD